MKILSITAQKPHSTGSGTYMTELVRSWSRAGHTQAVVCGIFPDDKVSFPDGVTCYPVYFTSLTGDDPAKSPVEKSIPFPVVGMSDIMPYESTLHRDLTPEMISIFEDVFMEAVGQAVDDLDPDLIVCHHLFLLTALVRKHFPERKIAGISHGTDLRQMINCDNLRDFVRPYIAGLDMLLALHEDQKQRISDIFGVSSDKVRVIGSGYNDRLFHHTNRMTRKDILRISEGMEIPVMICYAGKMSKPKGVPELLNVLSGINDDPDMPAIEVTLAGGCQDESVMKMLEELPENIQWAGQVPQERLADVFRYCDIFVLPSYFEGLPLVLIEAMASGMVPVSTDLPGVRPWLDANVPDHNVVFVPMPEMATIDTPTEEGRRTFEEDLYSALSQVVIDIFECKDTGTPDTSGITWDSVAERILNN